MSAQLIITMRASFAKAFAKDRSLFDISEVLNRLGTARLVGAPGYSMRVVIDEAEVPALREVLGAEFVVEPDYVMDTFGGRPAASAAPAARSTARTRPR